MNYDLLKKQFLGNRIFDYLLFIGILAACLIIIPILKKIIYRYMKQSSEKTKNKFDNFFVKKTEKNFFHFFI